MSTATLSSQALVTTGWTTLPSSATVTVTVPAGATATGLINAEGDIALNNAASAQGMAELHLLVDNVIVRKVRASAANTTLGGNMAAAWHLGTVMTLSEGSHTVTVEAKTILAVGGTNVTVNSLSPGALNIVVLQ